ncbi:MAG TPA: peptide chain release factor N(5)-glutamine methyltransferase [Cyanobacteria bacterium UBA11369]|nr:peptide chain release factor N(5)-glutamine methyltransferase [Cyanobacteria bacterium UBA11371]HBE36201.1 peptide chain release factor N(5)-glutamine methyltransferase [Cyanobacteria bacterium UBA11368]HBE51216.1 peptide chain release factor N(5)-glutamine methyltransferase [Cyanobacteria bacterium UBA11369]
MENRQGLAVSGLELWHWRRQALATARAAAVPVEELDWLLLEVADLDRLALRLESFRDRKQINLRLSLPELDQLWQRRISDRLPVQYIAGVTPWRNFSLVVSPAVLIPRPETELLIDLAVEAAKAQPEKGDWADLGTGSGAIAIGLAAAFPNATIHAVDRSTEALAIARQNAQQQGFAQKINFYQGSWFEPLEAQRGRLVGMISNPPYIPSSIVPTLQPEVAFHEPHLALDGGEDGLDCIRHLIETAPIYLRSGGIWLIEMMGGQADAVAELLQQNGCYYDIQIHPDLAGIERFALAYRC